MTALESNLLTAVMFMSITIFMLLCMLINRQAHIHMLNSRIMDDSKDYKALFTEHNRILKVMKNVKEIADKL